MDTSMIERAVRAIIVEQFNLPEREVTRETSLEDDLGADSLALTELAVRIEERFGVELSDLRRTALVRVADIVDFLASGLEEPGRATAA